ncbi:MULTISPECIES: hypothetical protein [Mesorhizobium]|uniref:hypothetical protein n=1 Tax=Mesorhizobium TaxID=68287 RepID=UPI000AD31F46|nr:MULTISPECIES: hypothetical protein [Mesorhizobium]MDF3208434.1 hypothetical protein [Mesorhizobium sp. LMG15046]MDF3228995.1 hypothetical protein [Mesorhizobium sp. DSM 30133]
MIDIIVEGAAAINLAVLSGTVKANDTFALIAAKLCPAVLALCLGVHAYGKLMGWPV